MLNQIRPQLHKDGPGARVLYGMLQGLLALEKGQQTNGIYSGIVLALYIVSIKRNS